MTGRVIVLLALKHDGAVERQMPFDEKTLPQRLRPVLALPLTGRRTAEIAAALGLRPHTVDNYVSEILSIYGCRTRVQLVLLHSNAVQNNHVRRKLR